MFACANPALCAPSSPALKPSTDPCPLHAVQFSLAAQGNTGHIDRYVVGLMLTGKDPVTASLQIPGLDEALLTPVIGADPQGRSMLVHYVVDIPRAVGAQSVRVLGILLHAATEREVTCKSPQRLVQSVPAAQMRFDDATLPGSDMLYLRQATEARVIRTSAAIFPASAAKRAQAPAVVAVTVGAQGAVLAERIESTSGDAELDRSALTAAKHSVFSEPQFDGAPIALDYLLTFTFGP
jgi:TonB family protein